MADASTSLKLSSFLSHCNVRNHRYGHLEAHARRIAVVHSDLENQSVPSYPSR